MKGGGWGFQGRVRYEEAISFIAAKDEFDPLGSSICLEKKRKR